ncbi:MAG TPA: hypothetical protein VK524_12315 [Polyangiaceae bacterium]|nr:hypothetical protein [Polyangiaceae bacterium]
MCSECVQDPRWLCTGSMASLEALRFVFAAVLDREVAAACIDLDVDGAVALWPSSLYGMLAAAAIRSPVVWCRCSHLVDARFGDTVARLQCASPAALVRLFLDGRDVLSTHELAGLLWVLLRRRDADLGFIEARLGAEMVVVAACRTSFEAVPHVGFAGARRSA